jgi:hypothetical protein
MLVRQLDAKLHLMNNGRQIQSFEGCNFHRCRFNLLKDAIFTGVGFQLHFSSSQSFSGI